MFDEKIAKAEALHYPKRNEDFESVPVMQYQGGGTVAETSQLRMPLAARIVNRSSQLQGQNDRLSRALDILSRHPEFEEFLELKELLEGGLFY